MTSRTFETPRPITVTVDIFLGHIRFVAGDRADTVVDVQPTNEAEELDVKTAATTRVELAGDKLTVKGPRPIQAYWGSASASVVVTVRLPAGSRVTASTHMGDIGSEGTLGDCRFRSSMGDIVLHRTGSLRAKTPAGRITADRVSGDAQLTGGGDLQVTEITGAGQVKNIDGPSWIGQAGGALTVNAAHGDISIDRAGSQVNARTAHGNVRVGEVAAGTIAVQTASGSIEIGIRRGTAAWLDVKSSYGTVRTELETGGAPDGPEQTATVRARTWDGDILVHRA